MGCVYPPLPTPSLRGSDYVIFKTMTEMQTLDDLPTENPKTPLLLETNPRRWLWIPLKVTAVSLTAAILLCIISRLSESAALRSLSTLLEPIC